MSSQAPCTCCGKYFDPSDLEYPGLGQDPWVKAPVCESCYCKLQDDWESGNTVETDKASW